MTKLTLTQKKILGMLTENTGRHMLDSGGAYGRMWERNQGRKLEDEPETSFKVEDGFFYITHNIYHWLSERLEYLPDWQRRFTRFANREDQQDETWFKNVENFIEYLRDKKHDIGGPYDNYPYIYNTCNGEDCLSQGMQLTYFTVDDEPVIALFIHGGCDVRGGYTAPKLFTESGMTEYAILDGERATLYCQKEEPHIWDTYDGGCTFNGQGSSEPDLKNTELVDFLENEDDLNFAITKDKSGNIVNVQINEVIIDSPMKSFKGKEFHEIPIQARQIMPYDGETGKAYCPVCGEEVLACSY